MLRTYFLLFTWIITINTQAFAQTNPTPSPDSGGSPVAVQSVADSVYQGYATAIGAISDVFEQYFGQDSASFFGFANWITAHNFWALVNVSETTNPNTGKTLAMNTTYNLQVQAAQNANFSAGVKPELFISMNDLVQMLMVGVVFPLTDGKEKDGYDANMLAYESITQAKNRCNDGEWEKRFSADDYQVLCSDSQYSDNVQKILNVMNQNISEIDFYRRLLFYYGQIKNCSDSINALKNTTQDSSSSSSSSMGGQTIPDTSDISSSQSGIPYVQCYFSYSSGKTSELANTISTDLSTACNKLTSSSSSLLYQTCIDLHNDFDQYASDAKKALSGKVTYSATKDNGVFASYGSIVTNMKSTLESSLQDTQEVVYSDVFNSDTMISDMPLMESIYPSMDNVLLPSQYGSQKCNPVLADQDTEYKYFAETDTMSTDYAYYFIVGLDRSIPDGLSLSEAVDLTNMDDSTTNSIPVYIHGGRFIYCDKNNSDTDVYASLCQDEKDNVYTTDLSSTRSGLYSMISQMREQLGQNAQVYLAQRSATFSNLWAMYNHRALVGNVSKCTPAQLATYHATWRYTRQSSDQPSWQETIRTNEQLTQSDLLREAVLVLQDINYQLYQLNQTAEREMSINTITALTQLSTQAMAQNSSTLKTTLSQFNTGHVDASSASQGTSTVPSS